MRPMKVQRALVVDDRFDFVGHFTESNFKESGAFLKVFALRKQPQDFFGCCATVRPHFVRNFLRERTELIERFRPAVAIYARITLDEWTTWHSAQFWRSIAARTVVTFFRYVCAIVATATICQFKSSVFF